MSPITRFGIDRAVHTICALMLGYLVGSEKPFWAVATMLACWVLAFLFLPSPMTKTRRSGKWAS